jgi:capsular polysaccharide biosynthesis protein
MENEKVTQNNKSSFALELLGRITSYLDPVKTAIIFALAVVAALVGLLIGTLFVENEYQTTSTLAMVSRASQSQTANLSESHHVADVMQALYDNDSVINKTLSELKSNLTVKQFVNKLTVQREEKTVLVKITYTDTSKENAQKGIEVYIKNLKSALKENLKYDCFKTMVPPTQPKTINHTLTVVILAVVIELLIALAVVVVRVFPGVIIITGKDLDGFSQPVLGEVFTTPKLDEEIEEGEENKNEQ